MQQPPRLLIVDDDRLMREMLRTYLEAHGFAITEAGSGTEMRERIAQEVPHAVLLDIRLPGDDGLVLAQHLREHHDVAILMVTGASDVVDRVVGLELGADDYIAKPFDLRELLARIRSVLRRAQARPAGAVQTRTGAEPAHATAKPVRFGRCEIDLDSRRMFEVDGAQTREVPITAMEYDLLKAFLANPNRVLSRDQLLRHMSNREWEPFDRSIDIRIGRLRRKVEPDPDGEPRCIRTVRNAGYMFIPAAR